MSYNQQDAAIDAILSIAETDLASMDPDEIAEWAEEVFVMARDVRDGYDDNGLENQSI